MQESLNVTYIILGSFLVITLILGLYAGRQVTSLKEYAIGNGRFSTSTLVLTLLVTWIGGSSIIGSPGEIYKIGILGCFSWFATSIQFFYIAIFFSKKLAHYKGALTMGDLMEKFYGTRVRIISGLLTSLKSICVLSIQLLMLGKVIEHFLLLDSRLGIIICSVVLGIYSVLGGIKSVTLTDVFQFIILAVAIPLILSFCLNEVGGYTNLFAKIPKTKFLILENKHFPHWATYIFLCLLPNFLLHPTPLQRVLMARTSTQIRDMFLVLMVSGIVFGIVFGLMGLSMWALFPNMDSKIIVFHTVNNLKLLPVIKAVIVCGFFAIIMSTADSILHVAGLTVFRDVLDPIFKFKESKQLVIVKMTTMIISVFAILSTLYFVNTPYFRNINFYGGMIVIPVTYFPFTMSLLGLKSDNKSFVSGSICGLITMFSCYLITKTHLLSALCGMVGNALGYMISHIIQNKGVVFIKRDDEYEIENIWIPNLNSILTKLKNIMPTPSRVYEYCKNEVRNNGSQNVIFGAYCCINFSFPYFLWRHSDIEKFNFMTNMRFIGSVLGGILIVKSQWKEFLKSYYPIFWYATLIYCIPFVTTMMFLLTNGSTAWLISIGSSMFFLMLLVSSEIFIVIAPLGTILALLIHKIYFGNFGVENLGFCTNYYLIYQIGFPIVVGILFAYRKQIFNIRRGNIGLNLGSSLCHELRNTLYSKVCNQYSLKLLESLETKNKEGQREFYTIPIRKYEFILDKIKEAINFEDVSIKIIGTFENLFRKYKKSLEQPKVCSMQSIVQYALKNLNLMPNEVENIEVDLSDDFYVKVPKAPLGFTISNIIKNALKHGKSTKIKIHLSENQLIIRDNGIGIPESNLDKIFSMHFTTGNKDSTGIGLGFAKIIVKSFYGDIWCESKRGENSFTEFHIKFPKVYPSGIGINTVTEAAEAGRNQAHMSIAMNMLQKGKSFREIAEYMNLSYFEIEQIKKQLNINNS